MRSYRPMRLGAIEDQQLRKELQTVDDWLRQLSANQARTVTLPQGTPTIVTNPNGQIDTSVYLYLPGRSAGQHAIGRNVFDAKVITAGAVTKNPVQDGFGYVTVSTIDGPTYVNISIEETATSRPKTPTREWIFPAFNQLTSGGTAGTHYFVDESDFQRMTNKTLEACVYQYYNLRSSGYLYDPGSTRGAAGTGVQTFNVLTSGSFPTSTWPYTQSTGTNGTQPILYVPPLDYHGVSSGGALVSSDGTHVYGIIKVPDGNSSTPFQDGGFIYGGGTRRELYSMPATTFGTVSGPTSGSLPQWYPAVTGVTGRFNLSSAVVDNISPGTTGMVAGQRIRVTSATVNALAEDVLVKSVDSSTQITMSANWGDVTTAGIAFYTFGPVWITPLSLSGSIDHGTLLGLTDDDHSQYLLLAGRSTGQVIGSGTISGNAADVRVNGRLSVNTVSGVMTTDRMLVVQNSTTAVVGTVNHSAFIMSIGASGSTTATYNAALFQTAGATSLSGGTPTVNGASFNMSHNFGSGCSPAALNCFSGTLTASLAGSLDTIGSLSVFNGEIVAPSTSGIGNVDNVTSVNLGYAVIGTRNANVQSVNVLIAGASGTNTTKGVVARAVGLNLDSFYTGSANFGTQGTFTAGTSLGSPTLSGVSSFVSIRVGCYVTGTGIPANTYIISINTGASTATMSNNATATSPGTITVTVNGTITAWSGVYRASFGSVSGYIRYMRFIDNQTDIPSQHTGNYYFHPPTPSGYPVATAYVHIGAGTATASTAPIKLTAGTNLTTPESGAIEYDGTEFYGTEGTPTRKTFLQSDGTNTAAANVGTLNNSPVAGDPTIWVPVVIGGTTYNLPLW